MSNLAIHTENIGKRYRLGATVDFSRTFRELVLDLPKHFANITKSKAKRILNSKPSRSTGDTETPRGTFWALKDINLEINHGDVVGIIGRNGAGKSTLLKILSKITSPTKGIAKINGRVGSLLEVGTGFHPELTGKENIYLNGSILGMSKSEIDKKFDEIVAFAEVEQFLETPIKRYSSGMQVRLAFAVAAHLEPEILIIDEVLAVGDAAFQKKCLGKMGEVSKEGRTILFVSHNMGAVERLCNSGIILEKGEILKHSDNIRELIDLYLSNELVSANSIWINPGNEYINKLFQPMKVSICDSDGNHVSTPVRNDAGIYFRVEAEIEELTQSLFIAYNLYYEKTDYPVYISSHVDCKQDFWPVLHKGNNILISRIPTEILNEGTYYIKPNFQMRGSGGSKAIIVNNMDNLINLSFEITSVVNESPMWVKRYSALAPIIKWENIC